MQSLILNVATNSIFFNKYIIRQIHNRLHSARGCWLVLGGEGIWYPRLSLTSETSSKPPGIIGFPQTEGQTEGGRKTWHRDCSWVSLEGLLVTHIGSRAPVSHVQLSEVPGEWHLLSSHLPARGLRCHGAHVPPCTRLHSPGSVPTSRLSSGWPHHSHKNWVVEIILYTNLRDWMYKLVRGLMDFDILSQAAQTQMRNKSSWQSGGGGNVTESQPQTNADGGPLRDTGGRGIQHITIRSWPL